MMPGKEQLDKLADVIMPELERIANVQGLDDKALAWLILKHKLLDHMREAGSIGAIIHDEIIDRLYPEFDGQYIQFHDWGWSTPDGVIRYE